MTTNNNKLITVNTLGYFKTKMDTSVDGKIKAVSDKVDRIPTTTLNYATNTDIDSLFQ